MSVIIKKTESFIFSSSTANGAESVSSDGTQFDIVLNSPISIPSGAVSCDIGVLQANIWNITPNISAELKNNDFTYTTSTAPAGTYNITIPDGLYSLPNLNTFLSTQFANNGHAANLFILTGDSSTQKTVITILTANDTMDFTTANSVRGILGFDSRVAPSVPRPAGWNEFSDNEANFNRVDGYIITSNLINGGIQLNSNARGIITEVPITALPGSLIVYQPATPVWVNARELIGTHKTNFRFSLLDDQLRSAPTPGENWSFTLVIKYSLLLTDKNVPLRP